MEGIDDIRKLHSLTFGMVSCRLLRVDLQQPMPAFHVRRQAEPLKPRLSTLEHTEQADSSSLSLLQELKGLVLCLKATQPQKDSAKGSPPPSTPHVKTQLCTTTHYWQTACKTARLH